MFSETSVAWVQTQDFALEVQQNMRTFAQLPSSWAHSAAVVVIPENLALQAASLQAGQMGEQEIDFWGKVVGMEAIDEMVAFLQGSPCPIGKYSETECLFFLYKDGLNCVHPSNSYIEALIPSVIVLDMGFLWVHEGGALVKGLVPS